MFLVYFTEESVAPQKIPACIASIVCQFKWPENALVRMLPFQNMSKLILWVEVVYRKFIKMLPSVFKIAEWFLGQLYRSMFL